MVVFSFKCYGHPNVTSKHKTTLEFTTDSNLTLRGDCILGVRSTMNLLNLPFDVKKLLRDNSCKIKVILHVEGHEIEIIGQGHPDLPLSDETAIIIRRSNFVCPRTLMINSNKAAVDIPEEVRTTMKKSHSIMKITIQVEKGDMDTSKHA